MNFFIPFFLTGLFGGVSCMAIQGGLLASVMATQTHDGDKKTNGIRLTGIFLIGKIIAYTAVGILLGFLGSLIQMTIPIRIIFLLVASLFMLVTALNLLEVHPVFRNFAIRPPRFLYRFIRNESKSNQWFIPLFVGAMTIFLPCGTTQAIMVQAMSVGNPLISGGVLLAFTLGTVPLFFLFGLVLQTASDIFSKYFTKIAALIVLGLALWNFGNAFAIAGWDRRIASSTKVLYCEIAYCDDLVNIQTAPGTLKETTDHPTITIQATSYQLDTAYIKAGTTIRLTVKNVGGGGCIQAFTIPQLGIQKIVPVGQEEEITFTAPDKPGNLPFMCSMGMYRGTFIVQ